MRWLVVGEDLIDAEHYVCEQERALDRVSLAAADAPGSEEYSACDRDTYQCCVDISNLGKMSNPPKEVDGA